jgi:hypothetical protein
MAQPPKLYKYTATYQNKETSELYNNVEWMYLSQEEHDNLVFSYINTGEYGLAGFIDEDETAVVDEVLQKATDSEASAYGDGFAEGTLMAALDKTMDEWAGVAFKLESFDTTDTIKVFICGLCGKHDDFTEAATIGANMYLSVVKEGQHNLWHICKVCANG